MGVKRSNESKQAKKDLMSLNEHKWVSMSSNEAMSSGQSKWA